MTQITSFIIAAFIFGLLAGGAFGYKQKGLYVDSQKVELLEAQKQALIKQAKESDKIINELHIKKNKTKIIYQTIEKEVPKYVTKIQKIDSDCNITRGTYRLLEEAAGYLPNSSRGADKDNGEPSQIREADLVRYIVQLLKKYKEEQEGHNALIRWHLVNK